VYHVRTGRFFLAILVGLSMSCAPAAQARAADIGPTFAYSPTAMPSENLGGSGRVTEALTVGAIGSGHYVFTTRRRPVKVTGTN
jgi:hypothetical protein